MIRNKVKNLFLSINNSQFKSKLLKNIIISFIGEGGAAIVTFITTILLIATIGDNAYGILTIANSYILIIDSIINFQSWQTVVKFGSEDLEKSDYFSLEKLIKVCCIIDLFTAFLGAFASLLLASYISNIMSWSNEITNCIYILSIQIFFNFTGTSVGVIRLLNKFKYYSIFRIFAEIIRLLLVIILCNILHLELIGATIAFTISYIAAYILFICLFLNVIRKNPNLSLRRIITHSIKDKWKIVINFTFWTNLSASADIPVQQFDIIFLSVISNEIVAVFKVYKQIGSVLNKLMVPIKQAVMPLYAEYIAKGKYKECYNYLLKMKNKSLQIILPVVLMITCLGIPILNNFLGELYSKYWYILLTYLLLRTFALSYATIHSLFITLGQVKLDFIYTLNSNIAYTLITYFTINKIGIWAILIGMFVQYISLIYLKKRKIQAIVKNI